MFIFWFSLKFKFSDQGLHWYLVDCSWWRFVNVVAVLVKTASYVEKLQNAHLYRCPDGGQFHSNEERPQDVPLSFAHRSRSWSRWNGEFFTQFSCYFCCCCWHRNSTSWQFFCVFVCSHSMQFVPYSSAAAVFIVTVAALVIVDWLTDLIQYYPEIIEKKNHFDFQCCFFFLFLLPDE